MPFFCLLAVLFGLFCNPAHADTPSQPTTTTTPQASEPATENHVEIWYGWMVVDSVHYKIAFLKWDGEGDKFKTDTITGVVGTKMEDGSYLFAAPPGFFQAVVVKHGEVFVFFKLNEQCTLLFPAEDSHAETTATGVTGELYHTTLDDTTPVLPIGNCSAFTDQSKPAANDKK